MNLGTSALLLGIGATLVMDIWGSARGVIFGLPKADYGLVGRWIGHMRNGQFRHERIAAAAPVAGERMLGWFVHYLTGIAFAALLLAIRGTSWAREPALLPAVVFGMATVAVPFLLMQPCMGLGVAASRAPRPHVARAQSLLTHAIFGLGLYLAARLFSLLPEG